MEGPRGAPTASSMRVPNTAEMIALMKIPRRSISPPDLLDVLLTCPDEMSRKVHRDMWDSLDRDDILRLQRIGDGETLTNPDSIVIALQVAQCTLHAAFVRYQEVREHALNSHHDQVLAVLHQHAAFEESIDVRSGQPFSARLRLAVALQAHASALLKTVQSITPDSGLQSHWSTTTSSAPSTDHDHSHNTSRAPITPAITPIIRVHGLGVTGMGPVTPVTTANTPAYPIGVFPPSSPATPSSPSVYSQNTSSEPPPLQGLFAHPVSPGLRERTAQLTRVQPPPPPQSQSHVRRPPQTQPQLQPQPQDHLQIPFVQHQLAVIEALRRKAWACVDRAKNETDPAVLQDLKIQAQEAVALSHRLFADLQQAQRVAVQSQRQPQPAGHNAGVHLHTPTIVSVPTSSAQTVSSTGVNSFPAQFAPPPGPPPGFQPQSRPQPQYQHPQGVPPGLLFQPTPGFRYAQAQAQAQAVPPASLHPHHQGVQGIQGNIWQPQGALQFAPVSQQQAATALNPEPDFIVEGWQVEDDSNYVPPAAQPVRPVAHMTPNALGATSVAQPSNFGSSSSPYLSAALAAGRLQRDVDHNAGWPRQHMQPPNAPAPRKLPSLLGDRAVIPSGVFQDQETHGRRFVLRDSLVDTADEQPVHSTSLFSSSDEIVTSTIMKGHQGAAVGGPSSTRARRLPCKVERGPYRLYTLAKYLQETTGFKPYEKQAAWDAAFEEGDSWPVYAEFMTETPSPRSSIGLGKRYTEERKRMRLARVGKTITMTSSKTSRTRVRSRDSLTAQQTRRLEASRSGSWPVNPTSLSPLGTSIITQPIVGAQTSFSVPQLAGPIPQSVTTTAPSAPLRPRRSSARVRGAQAPEKSLTELSDMESELGDHPMFEGWTMHSKHSVPDVTTEYASELSQSMFTGPPRAAPAPPPAPVMAELRAAHAAPVFVERRLASPTPALAPAPVAKQEDMEGTVIIGTWELYDDDINTPIDVAVKADVQVEAEVEVEITRGVKQVELAKRELAERRKEEQEDAAAISPIVETEELQDIQEAEEMEEEGIKEEEEQAKADVKGKGKATHQDTITPASSGFGSTSSSSAWDSASASASASSPSNTRPRPLRGDLIRYQRPDGEEQTMPTDRDFAFGDVLQRKIVSNEPTPKRSARVAWDWKQPPVPHVGASTSAVNTTTTTTMTMATESAVVVATAGVQSDAEDEEKAVEMIEAVMEMRVEVQEQVEEKVEVETHNVEEDDNSDTGSVTSSKYDRCLGYTIDQISAEDQGKGKDIDTDALDTNIHADANPDADDADTIPSLTKANLALWTHEQKDAAIRLNVHHLITKRTGLSPEVVERILARQDADDADEVAAGTTKTKKRSKMGKLVRRVTTARWVSENGEELARLETDSPMPTSPMSPMSLSTPGTPSATISRGARVFAPLRALSRGGTQTPRSDTAKTADADLKAKPQRKPTMGRVAVAVIGIGKSMGKMRRKGKMGKKAGSGSSTSKKGSSRTTTRSSTLKPLPTSMDIVEQHKHEQKDKDE